MKAVQGNVSTLLERKALSETEHKMDERTKRNFNGTMILSKLKQKTNYDQAKHNTRSRIPIPPVLSAKTYKQKAIVGCVCFFMCYRLQRSALNLGIRT